MADLTDLARRVSTHPGLLAKRDLAHVAATVGGDGDDAALINIVDQYAGVLAAEAIRPELIAADPRVAGIAGVVTVLNDLAATGAHPMAILDTVVGSDAVVRDVRGAPVVLQWGRDLGSYLGPQPDDPAHRAKAARHMRPEILMSETAASDPRQYLANYYPVARYTRRNVSG